MYFIVKTKRNSIKMKEESFFCSSFSKLTDPIWATENHSIFETTAGLVEIKTIVTTNKSRSRGALEYANSSFEDD
jgi:hypothetical protein